jgi:radical SAM superfamily enzyme YgiQ (UPF0313 family)
VVRILLANLPWVEGAVRAGSRWPAKYPKDLVIDYMPFPFYLAYTSALLENVTDELLVMDCLASRIDHKDFFKKCKSFNPEISIIETASTSFKNDIEICKKLKDQTDSIIVLTGPHATIFYREILSKYPFIDLVVLGEYELTILELVKSISSGKDFKKIRGLAFKKGNKIISSVRPLLQNLDELPFPAWHLFPMDKYNDAFCRKYPNFQLLSSRGCLFKCIFCLYPQTMEFRTFRFNSPERTIKEMKYVIEKYKSQEIYFDDSTFTMNMDRIFKLCNLIINEDIDVDWSCMTHAQVMNKDLIDKMSRAGCTGIKFGIESANQNMIYRMGKALNLEHAKKVFKLCKEAGMRVHLTFMLGLPGETKKSMKKTIRFAMEVDPDSAQFSIATPFPGTEFYRMAKENGWLIEEDFSLYDGNNRSVISYPNMTNTDLEEMLKQVRRRWILHVMSKPTEAYRLISIAYRQGGLGRVILNAKKGMSETLKFVSHR